MMARSSLLDLKVIALAAMTISTVTFTSSIASAETFGFYHSGNNQVQKPDLSNVSPKKLTFQGIFSGEDSNKDGFIERSELASFAATLSSRTGQSYLWELKGIGEFAFDIKQKTFAKLGTGSLEGDC